MSFYPDYTMTEDFNNDFLTVDPETENYINFVLDDTDYDWSYFISPATTTTTTTTAQAETPFTSDTEQDYSSQNEFEVFQSQNFAFFSYSSNDQQDFFKKKILILDGRGGAG